MIDDFCRRISVASRTLAAVGGGYVLTSLVVALVPLLFPSDQAVVLLWASMVSFPIYAAIIMAVFHARTASLAWVWMVSASVPLGIMVLILLPGATR